MRLKKLKIAGFKSFATATTISFDGSVVAVVGPNGCGKSNIVDAFRWVMGEQSGRLRGDKMEDVLFAGTKTRPAQNMAEVALTFSGVQESLNLPFDELTIIRKCTRDGDSEYFINGKSVRLKEVQLLFSGSGVGKNALAIFEQGKLDQIIYLQPQERRKLFDEAAGIGRFLTRKKESLQKLEEVEQNCLRVKDLHLEAEKRVEQLQKQATLAEKNLKWQAEHLSLQKAHHFLTYRKAEEEHRALLVKSQNMQREIAEKEEEQSQQKELLLISQEQLHSVQQERSDVQKRLWQDNAECKVDEVRLEEQNKQREKLLVEREAGEKRRALLEKELALLQEQMEGAKATAQECKQEEKRLLEEFEAAKKADIELEKESGSLIKIRNEKQQERFSILERTQAIALLYNECKNQKKNLEKEYISSLEIVEKEKGREALLLVEVEEKRALVGKMATEISSLKERAEQNRGLLKKIVEKKKASESEYQRIVQDVQELQAKEKALLHLEKTRAGFSEGAKALLAASEDKTSPLYSKIESLGALLAPKEGAETVITAALSFYLDTLIVKSKEDLERVIVYAKEREIAHFSLLCMEHILPSKVLKNSVSEMLQPSALATHLLGRVRIQKSFQLEGATKYVTEEGYFVDENGVLFSHKPQGDFLFRKRELKGIAEALLPLLEERKEKKSLVEALHIEEKNLIEETHAWEIDVRKKEMVHLTEKLLLNGKSAELKSISEKRESIVARIAELEGEKEGLNIKLQEGEVAHIASQEKEGLLLASFEKIELALSQKSEEKKRSRAHLTERQGAYQNAFERGKNVLSELFVLEKNLHAKEESLQRNSLQRVSEEEERERLIYNCEQLYLSLQKKKGLVVAGQSALTALDLRVQEAKKAHLELEATSNKITLAVALLKEKRQRLELSVAELFSEKRVLEERGVEEVALPSLTLEEMQKRMEEIDSKLNKSGPVNFASIQDLKVERENFSQLNESLEDILKAKKDLELAIQLLDRESKKSFKSHFQKIREKFQEYFALLFEGGEADLLLSSETDFFAAGVEIQARPPGKKMQRMSLLSGGEKCLTALALLFAFFAVTPAPFCILDEVDAPLDDTNVERFTNLLKCFTEKTQFVVVTHNKRTMAVADILVGVSMEEKGVSRLLSLLFEKHNVEVVRV